MVCRRLRQLGAIVWLLFVPAARAAEVAVLVSREAAAWRPTLDALRREAAGHTLAEHNLRGDGDEAERVLRGLKGSKTILVVMGPLAAKAALDFAPGSPLVYCMVPDPAGLGLLKAPNAAGVAFSVSIKNQFAAFRMVHPRAIRIGVIYDPDQSAGEILEARKATAVVRVTLLEEPVQSEYEVASALLRLLTKKDIDALWILSDPIVLGDETRRFLLSETLRAGKPVFTALSALIGEGALVSSGPDYTSIGELAGELVNRMARGERLGSRLLIPRAGLLINKEVGEKLGIELPPGPLHRDWEPLWWYRQFDKYKDP